MNIQQTAEELQKFADANGLNIDVSEMLNAMTAGDFIEINSAMDRSNNREIMKILQKYKARASEYYEHFNGNSPLLSESLQHMQNMGSDELNEMYQQYVFGALTDSSHLTLSEMRALVMEDLATSLNANQIASRNNTMQQQKVNPQTQMKMKQAQIQRNSNNQNFKVTVPGQQNGTTDVENVVGIDAGPTPQTTLVVTKDNNRPNELSVYGLNDIDPVNNGSQVNVNEENQNSVMAPPEQELEQSTSSPLTHTPPSMGELYQEIGDLEGAEDIHGEDSPLGNKAMHQQDELIDQIMSFCSKLKGR